jgi:hypothetical protein
MCRTRETAHIWNLLSILYFNLKVSLKYSQFQICSNVTSIGSRTSNIDHQCIAKLSKVMKTFMNMDGAYNNMGTCIIYPKL